MKRKNRNNSAPAALKAARRAEKTRRKSIAAALLANCPEESRLDHQYIATAVISGYDKEVVLSMEETERWPETYAWLKNEL